MRHLPRVSALLAAAALASACTEKPQPAKQPAPAAAKPSAFTLKDLALATAVDAKVARLSLAAADLEAAVTAAAAKDRARAKELLPALDSARAETEQAVQAVANAADRAAALRVATAAKDYADRLAASASAAQAASAVELALAREQLGAALSSYRASRATWRFDAPEPQGAERDFAEARRDMERAESAFMSRTRVAPRESGHEFDAAAARMTGQMAVERAKAAAGRLSSALQPHAARYAAAQAQVLEAVNALQGAGDAEKARVARAYHAAKTEALAALADYFAALAAR